MTIKEPMVNISGDEMEAYIYLPVPSDITSEYKVGELIEVLKKYKVISGIDQEALLNMVKGHIYLREVLVAKGREATEGQDGYYKFEFELKKADEEFDNGPADDLDYSSYKNMELVEKGDLVATYVPAVHGTNGYTVTGRILPAKVVRQLPPLKGRGIEKNSDGKYIASESGRIDIVGDRVMIHPLIYIDDDLTRTDEPIGFRGDVVVHGNVNTGAKISATGNVIVDGVVEGAIIDAGGDLLVRGGISGNNLAEINAKGKIVARFIERASVRGEGSLRTDIIMDSEISVLGKISVVSGKGTILGGMVHSLVGIEANDVGNNAELPTRIRIGVAPEDMEKVLALNKANADYEMSIMKANNYLKHCEEREILEGISLKEDPDRLAVLKAKIQATSKQALTRAELKVRMEHMARGTGAMLVVNHDFYPKTTVYYEDLKLENTNIKTGVYVKKLGKRLKIDSLN
ncbi:MAG: FapA family protein [Lachnospiraceae bacterium]|nr:FapA family protein [Lachnospiraceae bacterium]